MNENTHKNGHKKGRAQSVPGYQLHRLNELIEDVRQCCEDSHLVEAEELGLPCAEIRCLLLFGSERYLTVKGVAERLEVAKSRVTKIVNSMNEKGLLERVADPADGRVRLLRLTSAGRSIVERANALQKQMQAAILEKLDPDDRSRVISGLELLRAAMHEAKAEVEDGRVGSASGFNQKDEVDHV
ncbi:MAG: winged helix-turn-helix transcriptional regulator [Desulfobacterales bacterium]|nr:winged helix-turn-helix transcriptional regulator [Desulfobacterales bacterium]